MSWRGFGGSLVFAAVAGLASYPLTLVLMPFFGWWGAPGVVIAIGIILYTAGLLRGAARRLAAASAISALALALYAVGASFPSVAVALSAALALTRSAFAFRMRSLRAFALEVAIGVSALAMLLFFAAGGPGATALGVWGYFLIHSGYYLVGGRGERELKAAALDPFDEAQRQAQRILDGV